MSYCHQRRRRDSMKSGAILPCRARMRWKWATQRVRILAAMSLEFRGVGHSYGREQVLSEVTLTAAPGEITCLLGASGSGKSTLLRLAAGLERIQAGEIRLDGEILSRPGLNPPAERRPVGLVFQEHVLFPHKTALDNVAFGLRELGPRQRRVVAQANLSAVGLDEFGKRYPDTLSGGQQQRVALARGAGHRDRGSCCSTNRSRMSMRPCAGRCGRTRVGRFESPAASR